MDRPRAESGIGFQAQHTTAYDIELQESTRSQEHGTYSSMESVETQQVSTMDTNDRALQGVPTQGASWARPDYSDLEVCEVAPQQVFDDGKITVIEQHGDEKLNNVGLGGPLSPSSTDPVPAYTPAHRTSTMPLAAKGEFAQWDSRSAAPAKEDRKILGMSMSKKKLSFIGIGILAFILILLATVLGITLTMNIVSRQKSDSNTASTTGSALGIHLLNDNSGLAALNWTDPLRVDRSAVFWQDRSDSLMVSVRDPVSNAWTQSNVTQALLNNTGASRLDVLSGTPLATVTNTYQISLYYLTSDNSIAEIYSPDIVGEVWYAGSLGTSLSPLTAIEGSHISAYWQLCDNCTNSLFVTFQDDSGVVKLANLTNDSWEFGTAPDALAPLSGTGLAIRPYGVDAGAGEFGTQPVELRLYSFDSTGLAEAKYGTATNQTWEIDTASK